MNITSLSLAVILAIAGSTAAMAQEGTQDFNNLPASVRTRAEVRAELAQAQAAGELEFRGEAYGGFLRNEIASNRTRAQVQVEFAAARRAGELQTRNESYGSFARSDIASTKTRTQVQAEVAEAIAGGAHLSRGERS